MQKSLILFMLLLGFISCSNAKTNEKTEVDSEKNISVEIKNDAVDEGVIINGVKWATRNVDKKGTFTNNPEDIGMLYQWNSIVGWDVTNLNEDVIIEGWNKDINGNWDGGFKTPTPSDSWLNNVCPKGWRVPSTAEFEQLISSNSEWSSLNGQIGRYFGGGENKVFLPATGMLSFNGKYYLPNKFGAYWSSESSADYNTARYFSFDSKGVNRLFGSRAFGHCIRCVAEKTESAKQQDTNILKENNCKDVVHWGEVSICLPEIDKMKNAYSIPKMKKILDEWEYKNNTILACYVNDEIYAQIDNIEEIVYDDYFKIYSVNNFKNAFADKNALDKVASGTKAIFNTDFQSLSRIKEEIEKRNMSFDKPILIEDYHINSDINTFLLLMKASIGGYERIMVMTMNIAVVKNRIIYICYYKDYEGEESVKQARAKNDYFVLRLMNENQ
jgi:uncharacterized protein (TIGR02145 family)